MTQEYFIGLMSGTSLDGVDAALCTFNEGKIKVVATHHLPYSAAIRDELITLHTPNNNELEYAALMANALAEINACAVNELLIQAKLSAKEISAIGYHGQTVRHRPELGFTLQIGNAALLAELTKISVVADFRSRDIAAGGQGAPLVPAFHQAVFADGQTNRVVLNIGGIANITYLPAHFPEPHSLEQKRVIGFDTGTGNMLMDAWILQHLQLPYDANGAWAATGKVIPALLNELLTEPYFALPPPKSTGRDDFNLAWLNQHLHQNFHQDDAPQNVQRTLLELTAASITNAIEKYCPNTQEIYVCGGGAHNSLLITRLQNLLASKPVFRTDTLGIDVNWVEAAAFAWLARQTLHQQTANLPAVTGAKGDRILGCIYPY